MVRGVNKAVIEINDTENEFIERAILFVNPKYADRERRQIDEYAKRYLKGIALPDYCKTTKKSKSAVSRARAVRALSVISLALAAALILLLIIK